MFPLKMVIFHSYVKLPEGILRSPMAMNKNFMMVPLMGLFFLWLQFALVLRPSLQHRHHDSHSHDIVTNGWKIMSLSIIQSQHAINIYQRNLCGRCPPEIGTNLHLKSFECPPNPSEEQFFIEIHRASKSREALWRRHLRTLLQTLHSWWWVIGLQHYGGTLGWCQEYHEIEISGVHYWLLF